MIRGKLLQVFTPRKVRDAYVSTFNHPQGETVLAHLADACGATQTTARENTNDILIAEGRRQVWLLIQDMVGITEQEIRDMEQNVADGGS